MSAQWNRDSGVFTDRFSQGPYGEPDDFDQSLCSTGSRNIESRPFSYHRHMNDPIVRSQGPPTGWDEAGGLLPCEPWMVDRDLNVFNAQPFPPRDMRPMPGTELRNHHGTHSLLSDAIKDPRQPNEGYGPVPENVGMLSSLAPLTFQAAIMMPSQGADPYGNSVDYHGGSNSGYNFGSPLTDPYITARMPDDQWMESYLQAQAQDQMHCACPQPRPKGYTHGHSTHWAPPDRSHRSGAKGRLMIRIARILRT